MAVKRKKAGAKKAKRFAAATTKKRGPKPVYGEKKVTMSIRVSPTVKNFLAKQDDSASTLIEQAVRAKYRLS